MGEVTYDPGGSNRGQEWEFDDTTDSTVHEFEIEVPDGSYKTPLLEGHNFYHGDKASEWVPDGDALMEAARAEAAKILGGELEEISGWWVVTIDQPLDMSDTWQSIGDHVEGFSHDHWSIVVALNDLPEGAGADFRLVEKRDGEQVGKSYPHERGRGVIFRSQHWHGNGPLLMKCDRVSLAQVVELR